MEFKNLLFETENGVATITFNRPKALNAMNSETMKELMAAVTHCRDNDGIKVLILTGTGEKAFVAGADIAEMQNLRPKEALAFMELGNETLRLLETLPKPSLAAVNGFALGGGTEISMACDMRFASETARFGQPEILIGLIPGWGGTQRLARLVGMGRAKELIMSGEMIDAKRAYEIGLANRVFPADQLLAETKVQVAQRRRDAPARGGFSVQRHPVFQVHADAVHTQRQGFFDFMPVVAGHVKQSTSCTHEISVPPLSHKTVFCWQ